MKLKKVSRVIPVSQGVYDMYHCCRWCHYFYDGLCHKHTISDGSNPIATELVESGELNETLTEKVYEVTLDHFSQFKSYLRTAGLSKQKIAHIESLFDDGIETYRQHLIEDLGIELGYLVQDRFDKTDTPLSIENPDTFCCEDYL